MSQSGHQVSQTWHQSRYRYSSSPLDKAKNEVRPALCSILYLFLCSFVICVLGSVACGRLPEPGVQGHGGSVLLIFSVARTICRGGGGGGRLRLLGGRDGGCTSQWSTPSFWSVAAILHIGARLPKLQNYTIYILLIHSFRLSPKSPSQVQNSSQNVEVCV